MDSEEEDYFSNQTESSEDVVDISLIIKEKEIPASKLKEFVKRLSEKKGYLKEFHELNKLADNHVFSDFSESLKYENRPKNRYINVLPLNTTRVVLSNHGEDQNSDYINANYINGFREKEYIATQGPLKETVNDFWRMVYEQKSNVIVMLTKLIEDEKIKCYRYWPTKNKVKTYGKIKITNQKKEKEGDITIISLLMENTVTNEKRVISHFQYKEWPDHGLPSSASTFRHLLRLVDKLDEKKGPIMIHCSAGIGRTGTFCLVHTIIEETEDFIKKNPHSEPVFNIFKSIIKLRTQRPGSVQTEEQYEFCYKAICEEYSSYKPKEKK
eukprot:TRINITY_DN414_c0_g1_i1.p1 TRINITY_DN414_c0_g1~~TRINITY_DN414_c0_g1_i1.p1  ORF type:complete len:326 (-),score=79.42 TRINITY_DN414_c0_g1_i1:27-1004(-)